MANSELGPLSVNDFLGGALKIAQPVNGYRAGIDPVLLAACVPAKPGQDLLDLGCGGGVAALCVGRRVSGVSLYGLELQTGYAELARQNGHKNDLAMQVFEGSVEAPPKELMALSFDHVIANPPYYSRAQGSAATDSGRDIGRAGDAGLASWIKLARKRLKPGGTASIIQDAGRLPEILASFGEGFGAVTVLPIAPRTGRDARLVIVQARKNSAAPARILAPLILHDGASHVSDGDDYSKKATEIFRNAAPITL